MFIPLQNAKFSLDVSGIAGFFGGEESFAAMSSVHLIRGRRFFGWYNSPGSYFVAKKYGTLCHRRIWKGLFPGETVDPEEMLGLDGRIGPQYIGTQSGTTMLTTGHLAYLLTQYCKHLAETEQKPGMKLTIFDKLNNEAIEKFLDSQKTNGLPVNSLSTAGIIWMSLTISASLGAAIVSAVLWHDWPCFAAIFVGIICNGVSCLVLGSGKLRLNVPNPSSYSPPGDGIFWYDSQAVLITGGSGAISEKAISILTRGKFQLLYPQDKDYNYIGIVAFMLTVQVLAQLFLLPQATLVGQILFLFSFAVSWAYNAYLASMDREQLQIDLLRNILGNPVPLNLGSSRIRRTVAVVASAFYLKPFNALGYLSHLLPNDTPVWTPWKEHIARCVDSGTDPIANKDAVIKDISQTQDLTEQQIKLLEDFLDAAGDGYKQWKNQQKPTGSTTSFSEKLNSPNDSGKSVSAQRVTRVSTHSQTLFERDDKDTSSIESYA